MAAGGDGSGKPWGYLLPLQDGSTPVELKNDVYMFRQYIGASIRDHFVLRRDASSGKVLLCPETEDLWLNDQQTLRQRVEALKHGARITYKRHCDTDVYEYVSRKESDLFRAPPDVLEKYLVGRCLGRGSFGAVYTVFDKKQNYQPKAMKIVHSKNETELRYAKREARILPSLKHPCIIKSFRTKQLDKEQFLVMEYMAGGDLSQFVNDQRLLTEQETKLIFFQVALAVEYLHINSICHRDLKPGNILLRHPVPYSLIKLTDFGLSKTENDDSTMKTFAGSREYLAPEIINDDTYTKSVDVWSMGVILFYSLSGYRPFKNINEIMRRGHRIEFDPVRWQGVSLQARNLVMSMLKEKAVDRKSVHEVIEDPWLSDSKMRENACRLTGLEEMQLRSRVNLQDAAPGPMKPPSHSREDLEVFIPSPDYSDDDD